MTTEITARFFTDGQRWLGPYADDDATAPVRAAAQLRADNPDTREIWVVRAADLTTARVLLRRTRTARGNR